MSFVVQSSVDLRALEELADKWNKLGDALIADSGATKRAANRAALILVAATQEEVYNRSMSGGPASIRTGNLARSFRPFAEVTLNTMRIAAVSKVVYARIQDEGGIIRPKTRRALAIPLIPMAVGKWPRHWKKGELFRPKDTRILARKRGATGFEPVYALASSVRIQPKRYSERAIQNASPKVAKLLIDEVIKGVQS